MLVVLVTFICVLLASPFLLAGLCHVAWRRPSIGAALAVATFAYAWQHWNTRFVVDNLELTLVGDMVFGLLVFTGTCIAMATYGGSRRRREPVAPIPVVTLRRRSTRPV